MQSFYEYLNTLGIYKIPTQINNAWMKPNYMEKQLWSWSFHPTLLDLSFTQLSKSIRKSIFIVVFGTSKRLTWQT